MPRHNPENPYGTTERASLARAEERQWRESFEDPTKNPTRWLEKYDFNSPLDIPENEIADYVLAALTYQNWPEKEKENQLMIIAEDILNLPEAKEIIKEANLPEMDQ